ncbi:30S ribosomal protein S2 [Gramella sp. AN32]|uniref:Small ribosomal subunit protein uS2 n=1 Tax=Christiangramia antarctica TaxID=2058158 RepID=A0ABW5X8W9_9FLAO|nr:30S ribosomal protein S2 [Gramella sp. AN32]MCM4155387.1 30S ribosomal protein S2 [Gramella sp. AN32]
MANKVDVKELLDAGVHFGHLTRRWNPNMAPYIYMERNGIHIINLYKSAAKMQEAGDALAKIAASGRKVLFVATKKQAKEIVAEQAEKANMPYITERWPGGMLTNFVTIRKAVKKMATIDRMKKDGTYNTLSKKERLQVDRLRAKLEKNLGSINDMSRLPAALFVVDITREHIAIKEAQKLNIPIFAMVDTNSDPREVEYVIPSNDDASKSISKVVSYMADAIVEGLSERKTEKSPKKKDEKDAKAEKTSKAEKFSDSEEKKPKKKKSEASSKDAEVPSKDAEDKKAIKEAKQEVKLESKSETLDKVQTKKKASKDEEE